MALEIGAVSLLNRNHEIQSGIESCAAVTVFAHVPTKGCTPAKSCMSWCDLSARKVDGKLFDVSFWYVSRKMAKTCEVVVAMSEMSDMSHDVSFLCYCEGTEVCA